MALFFTAPFHLLRQGHLGHHMRNRSDDEAFDLYFAEDNRVWKHVVLYGVLTGGYWLFVVAGNVVVLLLPFLYEEKYWQFDRTSVAFLRAFNARAASSGRAVLAIGLHAGLVVTLQIPFCTRPHLRASPLVGVHVHRYGDARRARRCKESVAGTAARSSASNHNWHRTHHE
jgi:fatty acid desaturase